MAGNYGNLVKFGVLPERFLYFCDVEAKTIFSQI